MHRFGGIYESNFCYGTAITTSKFHPPPPLPNINVILSHNLHTLFFSCTNQEKKLSPYLTPSTNEQQLYHQIQTTVTDSIKSQTFKRCRTDGWENIFRRKRCVRYMAVICR